MTFPLYPAPHAGLADFAWAWAATYAGLLLLYFGLGGIFHVLNALHPERRIQKRPMKNQIAMEIRTSVGALASISLYVAGGLFVQAKGWALTPLPMTWWSVPLMFVVSLVIYDAWFYWGHRMMHSKLLYRFHAHHHRSIVPTPWSNNSDSQVGALVEQGYFLVVPFFLPIPPLVLIAHKIYDQVTGIAGHAGHEYFASPTARRPWPLLCTTFHDQHHGHFNYNYANTFSWWDRAMGTIHPRYDALVKDFEQPPARAHAQGQRATD
ncbi:MAG: sterol desaturase family protein [Hyphomicrobiaceae bacterium]|nr:sterol desaturase family protein [Hyphomicrobiaceae bacterium]